MISESAKGIVLWQRCRSCGGPTNGDLVPLGQMHYSQFPEAGKSPVGPKVPMTLTRCHDCGLIQLTHTTPREWLYREYWYRSGVNEAMRGALADVVDAACAMVPLAEGDAVLDIGANDGTLIRNYHLNYVGLHRVAYEPSQIAQDIEDAATVVRQEFFPPVDGFDDSEAGRYKHIHSIAMFYDLEDPGAFVAGVKRVLHPDGIWIVQLGDLLSMLETVGFDSICHEHLEYWSLTTFMALIHRHDLKVLDVQHNEVNGGSLRIIVAHAGSQIGITDEAFGRIRGQLLAEQGLRDTNDAYLEFKKRMQMARIALLKDVILANHLAGETVDLLAASTKCNTILQYCELGPKSIRRAIERSPEKVGRTTVTGIPIVSEEQGRQDKPARVLLVGAWQFADSIVARERGKWAPGTALVFPLPELRMVRL